MTYIKQQWKTGEIITEGKLNHIEDGIYNTDNDLTESKTLFANNILDLQNNKANQSDVVSINQEIDNISADLTAAEADIVTKAAQADVDTISNEVDTLQTQVTINTNNIKSLQDGAVSKSELDTKQDKLTAGNNITIVDNIISATGGSSTPDNMVTTDTDQSISGAKTLDKMILPESLSSKGIFIEGKSDASITSFGGKLFIYDLANLNAETIKLSEGQITLGDYQSQGNFSIKTDVSDSSGNTKSDIILNYNVSSRTTALGNNTQSTQLLGNSIIDKDNNKFLTDSVANKALIASWGLPDVSNSSYRVVVAASHTEYEMPFDGYMYFQGQTSSVGAYANADIYTNNEWIPISTVGNISTAQNLYGIAPLIPLTKGVKYRIRYTNMNTITIVCFPLLGGESA